MPTNPVKDPSFGVQDDYPPTTSMRIPKLTNDQANDIAYELKQKGKLKGKPTRTKAFIFAIQDVFDRMFP